MHLSDADLLLHLTGDLAPDRRAAAHLEVCPRCREARDAIGGVLATFDERCVPGRGPEYGARVWGAIEGRLDRPAAERVLPFRRTRLSTWVPHLAYAASLAALLAVSFALPGLAPAGSAGAALDPAPRDPAGDRILVAAVADHIDRTARMLTELNNADAPADVTAVVATADDLASANRLYRDAATQSGDVRLAALLDDLERVLIDVARDEDAGHADLARLRDELGTRDVAHRLQLAKTTLD